MNHPMRVIEGHQLPLHPWRYISIGHKCHMTYKNIYIPQCMVCQKMKYDCTKSYGLLRPLSIPKPPWESIAMDLIFGLPKSQQSNNGIWTIVDRFSKQAHFIPVKKIIKPHHMAKLFMTHIFKHHGFPKTIIFNRDPGMKSLFW